MRLSRRHFLTRLGGGAALVLVGSAGVKAALADADVGTADLPPPARLEQGDAHLAFGAGAIYRIHPEQNAVARVEADLTTERWRYGAPDRHDLLNLPTHLVVGKRGDVHVMDYGNARVVVLSPEGTLERTLDLPSGARHGAFDGDGVLWVAMPSAHTIQAINPDGTKGVAFGELGDAEHQLNGPRGVAVDADGRLHVADSGHARVAVFERTGAWVRAYGGPSEMRVPRSVVIDRFGQIYVADAVGGALSVFDESGTQVRRVDDLSVVPLDVSLTDDGVLYVRTLRQMQSVS